jgi:hypothetical protein
MKAWWYWYMCLNCAGGRDRLLCGRCAAVERCDEKHTRSPELGQACEECRVVMQTCRIPREDIEFLVDRAVAALGGRNGML